MKKKTFDENKVYKSIDEIIKIGSCRRKCKFICERCNSEFSYAIDVILKKGALLCKECSAKSTNMKRLGVEHPAQSKTVQEKMRSTCLEKYGVEYGGQTQQSKNATRYRTEETKLKYKNTCLERYGVDNYSKTEKAKQELSAMFNDKEFVSKRAQKFKNTMIERYRTLNTTQNIDYSKMDFQKRNEKSKKTLLEKYGVENAGQIPGIRRRARYIEDDICFDSSWELSFYHFLKENNYSFEAHPATYFEYSYENKVYRYFPDFIVNGNFIEIKGDHFFENGVLVNPYNRNSFTDGKYLAKYNCMKNNNVIILTGKDLRNMEVI